MYARVARFEGLDPSHIDEQIAEMRRQMADAAETGALPEGAPAEVRTLMETVTRFLQLVDRETGTAMGIVFAGSQTDIQRAHDALNAMSPSDGEGRRVGPAEIYEVALDMSFS